MIKPKILFLCSDNGCRTQMAEAFLRDMAGEHFEVPSEGAEANAPDPDAVAAMVEVGLDISRRAPKKVDLFLRERVAFLVTLCDRENERTCPIFPGATWRLKWPIENPASAKPGGRPDFGAPRLRQNQKSCLGVRSGTRVTKGKSMEIKD
jgi:arsenate reductase